MMLHMIGISLYYHFVGFSQYFQSNLMALQSSQFSLILDTQVSGVDHSYVLFHCVGWHFKVNSPRQLLFVDCISSCVATGLSCKWWNGQSCHCLIQVVSSTSRTEATPALQHHYEMASHNPELRPPAISSPVPSRKSSQAITTCY